MILHVYIDAETADRLRQISALEGRPMDQLADSAISEAALAYFRHRKDDPVRKSAQGEE
jgi:hypothetical protein